MPDFVARVARLVARLPGRLVSAAGWAHLEPVGLGVGTVHTLDVEGIERERRRDRELERRADEWRPTA